MIANQVELERTRSYLTVLESAVQELRERVRPQSPDRFVLMASSYLDEIKRIRFSIDEYVGVSLALEASSDFLVKFEGPLALAGMAPAPIVSRSIGALQRGLRRVGEYIARAELHVPDALTKFQLARHFELEVVTVTPGSLRVGLKISQVADVDEGVPRDSAAESSRRFSEALGVVLRGDQREFRRILPDLSFQLQVLKSMKELAPPKQKRDYQVSLTGRFIEGPLVLGEEQRSYISKLIRATTQDASQEGTVREINLEKHTFQIKSEATLLRCHYPAELEAIAKGTLDKRVRVQGRAKLDMDGSVRLIQVRMIEVL